MLNTRKVGLVVGVNVALWNAVWQVLVWAGSAAKFMAWILGLHSVKMSMSVTAFNATTAVSLVVVAFVCGYLMGWVFAWIWNRLRK